MNTPQRRWGGAAYLANWRLSNLKSVADADIDLSPLTVVVGPNSVGKSTLLQSILLLSQASADRNWSAGTVELNCKLFHFGTFKEARSDFASDKSIAIGGRLVWNGFITEAGKLITDPTRLQENRRYFRTDARERALVEEAQQADTSVDTNLQSRELSDDSAQEPMETLSCTYTLSGDSDPGVAAITKLAFVRHARARTDTTAGSDQVESIEVTRGQATAPSGYAPYTLKGRFDGVWVPAPTPAAREGGASATRFARFRSALPTEWVFSDDGESFASDKRAGRAVETFAVAWADYLRAAVTYLGPLREVPSINYLNEEAAVTQGRMPLGRRGEYTAAVLRNSRDRLGDYPVPEGRRTMPLLDAVNLWIEKFELGGPVSVGNPPGRDEIELRTGGRDLTQVGTGFSQLLPLIVICLIASPGSLVLLEQPELHLHPASQQKLADFFLAVVRSQRRLLVETHSEYLVSRLRRRVAEDPRNRADFGLVFAEANDGRTHFRTVETNDLGGIDDWPEGFFDQQSNDIRSLMRAAVRRLEDENATDR